MNEGNDGNAGNQSGNGRNAGNQGRNAGNQGENLRIITVERDKNKRKCVHL